MLTFIGNLPWQPAAMRAIIRNGASIRSLTIPQTERGYTFGVAFADLAYPFQPEQIGVKGLPLSQQPIVRLLPAITGEPYTRPKRRRRKAKTQAAEPSRPLPVLLETYNHAPVYTTGPARIVQDEHAGRPTLRDEQYDGYGFDPTLCRTCQRRPAVLHGWCETHQERACLATTAPNGRTLHWIIPTEPELDAFLVRLYQVAHSRPLAFRARKTFEAMTMAARFYAAQDDRLSHEDAEALGVQRWSELRRPPRRRKRA